MIVLLFILWIVFNGKLTVEIAILGILISLAVTIFTKTFFYHEKRNTTHIIREDLLTVVYIGVLVVEIIKANVVVLSIMISKEINIEPCFCYFKTDLKDPIHRILLANSITLTPGTITVNLSNDGEYKVHCLDKSMAEGIDDSVFVKMLRKMEEL